MRRRKNKRNRTLAVFCISVCAVVLILVIAIAVFLYIKNLNNNSVATLTPNQAIEHLETKYRLKAKACIEPETSMDSEFDIISCLTDSLDTDNEQIVVFAMRDSGDLILTDNYFGYIIRPEVEESIENIVYKEFKDCKVYFDVGLTSFPNNLNHGDTLEDLYQVNPIYTMKLRIYTKGDSNTDWDTYQNKVNRINKAITNKGWLASIQYFVVNDNVFNGISRYKQDSILETIRENGMTDGENCYYFYEYDSLVSITE